MVIATADGRLLSGYRRRFHARFPRRRLLLSDIGSWLGGLPVDRVSIIGLSLQPAGQVVALNLYEAIGIDEDEHVAIVGLSGRGGFGATDLAVPPQTWFGDDPGAPAPLVAAQAVLDSDWQDALAQDPAEPRWVLEWQFLSGNRGDQMRIAGWDANGDLLVAGAAVLDQRCPRYPIAAGDIGRHPWQGRVAFDGSGWDWTLRDYGPPPAPMPQARLGETRVEISGTALLIDGVAQANPELAAGVLAFDGPFT